MNVMKKWKEIADFHSRLTDCVPRETARDFLSCSTDVFHDDHPHFSYDPTLNISNAKGSLFFPLVVGIFCIRFVVLR